MNPSDRTTPNSLPAPPSPEHTLFTEDEASRLLRTPRGTLGNWRFRGQGPRYIRLGRSIRYALSDLEAYIDAGRQSAA